MYVWETAPFSNTMRVSISRDLIMHSFHQSGGTNHAAFHGHIAHHAYCIARCFTWSRLFVLDKKGTVKGWATDDGDSVRFYDKSFNPRGLYDRDTNTTFDKNYNPTGTIHDFDEDDD